VHFIYSEEVSEPRVIIFYTPIIATYAHADLKQINKRDYET